MAINKNIKALLISMLGLSVFIIAITVTILLSSGTKDTLAFFARSINDASYDCEDKIDRWFGSDLINKTFDSLSSRYEPKNRQYLIYYRVYARESIDDYYVTSERLAKCVVWEHLGYVSDFQIIKL